MMTAFTITLEIPALDRLTAVLSAQAGAQAPDAPKTTTTRRPPPSDKAPADPPAGDNTGVDIEALKAAATTAAMKLQKAQGRDALIALLGEFNAANISALTAEQLVEFAAKADEKSA
jgi:hypothetical protein